MKLLVLLFSLVSFNSIAATTPQIMSFHAAVDTRNVTTMVSMMRQDPSLINSHHPTDGFTPIIRAARAGDAYTTELLLRVGADPLLQEAMSMNAIAAHKVAFFGHIEVMKVFGRLLSRQQLKRMLEIQGPKNGKTVLMDSLWIFREGLPSNFQIPDQKLGNFIELSYYLIQLSKAVGANLDLRDHTGMSAFDYARLAMNRDNRFGIIARLLE